MKRKKKCRNPWISFCWSRESSLIVEPWATMEYWGINSIKIGGENDTSSRIVRVNHALDHANLLCIGPILTDVSGESNLYYAVMYI